MSGFQSIRSELRKQFPDIEVNSRLVLWFSFTGGVLYAHDNSKHNRCIALIVYDYEPRLLISASSPGAELLQFIINTSDRSELASKLNSLYKISGDL